MFVQYLHESLDDVFGHVVVYFAGEFYEARVVVIFTCLVCEVEGVERDAVAADAGARVEGGEAEGLGRGGGDDLPYVYSHFVVDDGHLVSEGTVDDTEGVFEYLCRLGLFGGGDGKYFSA